MTERGGVSQRVSLDDLPEIVTPAQLRHALGISGACIGRMQKAGSLPPRIPGTRNWYRDAVKVKLRQVSGLDGPDNPEAKIAAEEREMLREAGA